ncbi:MAG: hypothetical protein ACREQM_03175 [Candidatus Dormibacteraceae bacterium]
MPQVLSRSRVRRRAWLVVPFADGHPITGRCSLIDLLREEAVGTSGLAVYGYYHWSDGPLRSSAARRLRARAGMGACQVQKALLQVGGRSQCVDLRRRPVHPLLHPRGACLRARRHIERDSPNRGLVGYGDLH